MHLNRRVFLSSALASLLPCETLAETAADGFRILKASKTAFQLMPAPAPKTALLGFGARVPGPLLRYKKGEEVKIRLVNALDQPVTFSGQGLRIANAMDGVAGLTQKPILPGGSFDYRFVPPDAGFFWYRSDVLSNAIEQIERGLYGALIIDEPQPPQVDRDMLVMLADWHLDDKAQILMPQNGPRPGGKPLDHYIVTVNSDRVPIVTELAPGARLRLRLLSLVQSQLVFLTFAGLSPLVIGIDGQPCEAFAPLRDTIPIGPGARFDVLCDLPAKAGAPAALAWRTGERADRALITFMTSGKPRPALPPFHPLAQNPLLPAHIKLKDAHKVDLVLETPPVKGAPKDGPVTLPPLHQGPLTLNGTRAQSFAPKPLFSVKRGTPVTLQCANKSAIQVQIHVHGHAMRLLHDVGEGWEPYWRTRVIVPEGRTKRVAFVADNPGRWAIECQTLQFRPSRLVTWFEVT